MAVSYRAAPPIAMEGAARYDTEMTTPFSLLVKPAGPDCNLRCRYCFYTGRQGMFPQGAHRMSEETLRTMIASFLGTAQREYVFGWQGGEPTLMGLEFFRQATHLQEMLAPP
ncbi:MAG: hypothetical protein FWF84_05650, partial [Kiritimatiellaeota bacterium]|nr:hypothetical protein [Kiritimatiellota bacterium]